MKAIVLRCYGLQGKAVRQAALPSTKRRRKQEEGCLEKTKCPEEVVSEHGGFPPDSLRG